MIRYKYKEYWVQDGFMFWVWRLRAWSVVSRKAQGSRYACFRQDSSPATSHLRALNTPPETRRRLKVKSQLEQCREFIKQRSGFLRASSTHKIEHAAQGHEPHGGSNSSHPSHPFTQDRDVLPEGTGQDRGASACGNECVRCDLRGSVSIPSLALRS